MKLTKDLMKKILFLVVIAIFTLLQPQSVLPWVDYDYIYWAAFLLASAPLLISIHMDIKGYKEEQAENARRIQEAKAETARHHAQEAKITEPFPNRQKSQPPSTPYVSPAPRPTPAVTQPSGPSAKPSPQPAPRYEEDDDDEDDVPIIIVDNTDDEDQEAYDAFMEHFYADQKRMREENWQMREQAEREYQKELERAVALHEEMLEEIAQEEALRREQEDQEWWNKVNHIR